MILLFGPTRLFKMDLISMVFFWAFSALVSNPFTKSTEIATRDKRDKQLICISFIIRIE